MSTADLIQPQGNTTAEFSDIHIVGLDESTPPAPT
jgi:hypothetical protein